MSKQLAFNNDPALKARLLAGYVAHREADNLIKGTYWQHGKGCAVGCGNDIIRQMRAERGIDVRHFNHGDHGNLADDTATPVELWVTADRLFEQLPISAAQGWPERFTDAIGVGADLSSVFPKFILWRLTDELPSFMPADKFPEVHKVLGVVAPLFAEWAATGERPGETRFKKFADELRALALDLDLARARALALDLALALALDLALDLARALALDLARALALDLALALARALDLDRALARALARARALDLDRARARARALALARALDLDLEKNAKVRADKLIELIKAA